jgi:hypothetical protein
MLLSSLLWVNDENVSVNLLANNTNGNPGKTSKKWVS